MTLLLLALLSLPAHAAFDCQAFRWNPKGGSAQAPLEIGTDRPDLYTASVKIKDAYFRIQGLVDKNRYTLSIYLDEPQPDGSALFSDGAFDGDGYMRASFVSGGLTYKMICSKK